MVLQLNQYWMFEAGFDIYNWEFKKPYIDMQLVLTF